VAPLVGSSATLGNADDPDADAPLKDMLNNARALLPRNFGDVGLMSPLTSPRNLLATACADNRRQ
jgi:hypothetical protein